MPAARLWALGMPQQTTNHETWQQEYTAGGRAGRTLIIVSPNRFHRGSIRFYSPRQRLGDTQIELSNSLYTQFEGCLQGVLGPAGEIFGPAGVDPTLHDSQLADTLGNVLFPRRVYFSLKVSSLRENLRGKGEAFLQGK